MSTAALAATPSVDRTVIIATAGLDDEASASAQEACLRLSARPLLWSAEASQPAPTLAENTAVAVVAALPPGERQIPERLYRLATRDWPGAPLLLLCRESLVRPSVTLQNGRVTLVEPPFSVRRIASRLRVIFADARGPRRPERRAARTEPVTREHQRAGFWVGAVLGSAGIPWVDQTGLTAVVPAGDALPSADLLARAAEVMARGGDADATAAALRELAVRDGLIHLVPQGDELVIFWPLLDRPLWLASTQRLPPWWDLGATAADCAGRCFRVAAASGDTVVALPSPLPEWAPQSHAASAGVPAEVPGELADALADGGPAILEVIEARLRGRPSPFTLVIETR
jgi:hypothetical protein